MGVQRNADHSENAAVPSSPDSRPVAEDQRRGRGALARLRGHELPATPGASRLTARLAQVVLRSRACRPPTV
jgi:hypothetical protein